MLFEFDSKFLGVGTLMLSVGKSIYMYILLSLFEDMKTEESIFSVKSLQFWDTIP